MTGIHHSTALWRPVPAALLCVLCSACVQYQAAPLEPQRSAQAFAARQLDEPALRAQITQLMPGAATVWPPREWDRADLLAVALVQNPTLAVANAQARAALAHEITAGERPNPAMTLQSEYARHDSYAWLYGVAFNWLLRSPERRRLEISIAQLDTRNARLELMDQAWSVRHELIAALSNWEAAHRRAELLDRLATAQRRLVEFERQRIASGEDAPADLIASEHALLDIEQQKAEVKSAGEAARTAVASAVGVPPEALDAIPLSWPNWGDPPLVNDDELHALGEQALLSRADVAMAIGDYSAAEAKLQLAVARQYPEYELNPGFYWDHGIAKFPFDVSFDIPLNGNKGQIAEAFAGRDLAGQRMLAVQAAVYGDITAAKRAERIERETTAAAERQLDSSRRLEKQADLGLRLGAVDSVEQVGAQIIAMRAELDVLQARAQLQALRNALEDALRAPLSGPELKLSISTSSLTSGSGT